MNKIYNFKTRKRNLENNRLNIIGAIIFLFYILVVLRLFNLQVLNREFFAEASSNQHLISQRITPHRGIIYVEEKDGGDLYPVALNRELAFVYADPRLIDNPQEAAARLGEIFAPLWEKRLREEMCPNGRSYSPQGDCSFDFSLLLEEKKEKLLEKLSKRKDPYEVLVRKVPEDVLKKVLDLHWRGIGYGEEEFRYYPESEIMSQITGYVGYKGAERKGMYGVEDYFDDILRGRPGRIVSPRDAAGRLLFLKNTTVEPAQNGDDVVLTIDRAVQFKVCQELDEAVKRHGAERGMVIVMDPDTREIIAMCATPRFDANRYYEVEDISLFNNPLVFDQYEPGSVFKAITMAAGLEEGKVAPDTVYEDKGCVKVGVETICNSDRRAHGRQTMTNVLEESLNTGVIFVLNQIGADKFLEYVKKFGFGVPTGIEISGEASGDIHTLETGRKIYAATAAFGQGIAVTPLQMLNAFATIAEGGQLAKPHLLRKIIKSNKEIEKPSQEVVRRVISKRTALFLKGMLVSVVENGHGKRAGVKGYYVAGKTGTAQVPKKNGKGYEEDKTIGSFIGFAPVDNPRFVMLVRIDNPQDVVWAESSAAPLFGKLAKFLLNYYEVPPERE